MPSANILCAVEIDRWYVNDSGPSDDAVVAGIRWLVETARALAVDRAAILVPTVRQMEHLERSIGENRAADLRRNRRFKVAGVTTDVFAHRNPPPWGYNGPIFVVWGSPKGVAIAEDLGPPALCALEWNEGELAEWKRTWGPRDVETGEAAQQPGTPAVIVGAVMGISMSGDVVHPLDKGRAIDALKMLSLTDIPIDPAVIQAEAARQGWSPDGAERLRELAEKVASGTRVRGGSGRITKARAREAIKHWEQRAQETAEAAIHRFHPPLSEE